MAFHAGDETFIGRAGAVRDVQRVADGMAQDDDDVIGNIARKYWGFVRPDEKVYYDSND